MQEIVCLQCGDVGFSNAFVYCIKCVECAVHRYCLRIIPKSVDEFVRWICDDCEAEEQNQHLFHNKIEHDLGYAGTGMKKDNGAAPVVEEQACEGGLPQSYECSESDSEASLVELGTTDKAVVLSAPDEVKRYKHSSSQSHMEAKIKDNLIFNELSADTSPRGSVEKRRKELDFGTECAIMSTERRGINLSRESEVSKYRKLESDDIRRVSKDQSTISVMADGDMSAAPVMTPIWRGSLNLSNYEDDILEGVMAHMSVSACNKVYNEARLFKPVLDLEMLPIPHVWPESFKQSESPVGIENIALYFFPSESIEEVYDELVDEMVQERLALKGIVQNAELLVFPSTELQLSNWRFQGKYYLWGVFRRKRSVASRCTSFTSEGEIGSTTKNFGGSPLSNCSSNGSYNPSTKCLP